MTSQAVMKRYLTSVAKNNEEYKDNKSMQTLASLIANYKNLDAEDKEVLDAKIESAYNKLQAKGVSASKSSSKATTTRKPKSSSDGGLKGILAELKKKLGAEKFKDATRGTDIKKDIQIPALKKGKRIVRKKGYTTNQYGKFKNKIGTAYWESRANRYDANQPSQTRKYKLADGGMMNANENFRLRGLEFLKDDLFELHQAIKDNNNKEIEKFFSYWSQHLETLKTTNNERMFSFLQDDLVELHQAIKDNNNEEIEKFFSYWEYHLESLKYAKGGKLSSNAKYIPKRDIAEIEIEKNGKSKSIDGANLLDGVYVKKGTKYAKGGKTKKFGYSVVLLVKKPYGNEGGIIANFVGKGDAMISARALNESSPENYEYSVKDSSKMAKGGMTEHGLEITDRIIEDLGNNEIAVRNAKGDIHIVNLDEGKRYAKGGEVEITADEKRKSLKGSPKLKF